MFRNYQFKRFDWMLLLLIIGLSIFGIIVIASASERPSFQQKQIMGVILGSIGMITVSLIDYKFIGKFHWLLYGVNILLLALVLIMGENHNGATRWLILPGDIQIQPSEFSKIIMIICIAKFIDKHKERINNPLVLIRLGILVLIPVYMIKEQPALSTSLVFIFIFIVMLFVGGLSYKYILIALGAVVPLGLAFLWYIMQPDQSLLEPYQVKRIKSVLNPQEYLMTEYYQQYNSILAIGSGQLHGKGLNNNTVTSVKNADYLLEPETDFIFSVIGEELGFIGAILVIATIFMILVKCLWIAKDAKDTFGTLIITGLVAMITFQTFVNIGVATALLPNTGLPLPFVSYGLSSLSSTMVGMGLILNISMQRKGLIQRG